MNQTLNKVDKRGRTRNSKKAKKTLENITGLSIEKIRKTFLDTHENNTAPKTAITLKGTKNIYSEKGRSFKREFSQNWWAQQDEPWICYICQQVIQQDGKGADMPTIDHLTAWATIRTEIPTYEVCKDGVHWRVAWTDDVYSRIQEERNLAPAHKGCNSRKNGPKDTDSLAPQRLGNCPGGTCTLPNAS